MRIRKRNSGMDGARAVLVGAATVGGAVLWLGAAPPAQHVSAVRTTEAPAPVAERATDPVVLRAQLGIIYAQTGQRDRARAEFVKLLEEPQGRAAALTNLGNLSFLDGKLEEALESYRQAAALDTKDPGILLNQGLALKQLGRGEEAEKVFGAAVEMAGGVDRAAYLLGLSTAEDTGRGKVSKMTADELRQMLLKAKASVPAAPVSAKTAESTAKVTSRPGGARAAEVSVGEQNLYWKDR